MKLLTIIVPVYNVENYLKECLESIIQSDKDFEVLLIDDGSTDKSPKICDEYAKIDKRVRVYHKHNGGVSSARNYGLKKAKGNYIIFVDSDDVMSKDWDHILDYIKNDDIYYYTSLINENTSKEELLKYITGNNEKHIYISGMVSKSFKRDFLINNRLFFNENLINGEDMIYNIESILLANSFKVINFHYYYYRQTMGQSTRKFDDKIINSDKNFHMYLNKLFKKCNIDKTITTEIEGFCLSNAVIMILNRISYLKSYKIAKPYFEFLNQKPYSNVINDFKQNNFILKQCRKNNYKFLYYYLKIRNKFSLLFKYNSKNQFIKI